RRLGRGGVGQEALEEVAEGLADLLVRVEPEALAGPFGLARVEGTHQGHVSARLHGDDGAVAAARDIELDGAHVLVVGTHLAARAAELRGAARGDGLAPAFERLGPLAAQRRGLAARLLEPATVLRFAERQLAPELAEAIAQRGHALHAGTARARAPR